MEARYAKISSEEQNTHRTQLQNSRRKQLLQDSGLYPEFYKSGQKPSQPGSGVVVSKRVVSGETCLNSISLLLPPALGPLSPDQSHQR